MLVIAFASQTKNYAKEARDNQAWAYQEQQMRSTGESLNKVTIENYQKQVSNIQEELSKLRTETEKNAGEMASINNQLLAEQQKTASLTGQVTQLTSMINAGDAERKEIQTQLQNVRNDNTALRTDNIKLAETNQKLELQAQLYEQQIRLLKEQNFSLSERVEKLRSRVQDAATGNAQSGAAGQGTGSVSGTSDSPIVGEITNIRDNLVSLSIGSAQGVKDGMEFIVYRGAQYLGKIRITKVLPEQAAGEFTQKQGDIHKGDKVTDKFQL
jgi:predicted  nucleic acid-binding Zn-ribbon protein